VVFKIKSLKNYRQFRQLLAEKFAASLPNSSLQGYQIAQELFTVHKSDRSERIIGIEKAHFIQGGRETRTVDEHSGSMRDTPLDCASLWSWLPKKRRLRTVGTVGAYRASLAEKRPCGSAQGASGQAGQCAQPGRASARTISDTGPVWSEDCRLADTQ